MSSSGGAGPLVPTFVGFVHNSMDGLVLFEACLSGKLNHVPRRPHDRERHNLIKSGSIFIYEEAASGIKRWTDGVSWSPSRILGNFLIYRELEKPFAPGEKKRAMKKKRANQPGDPYPRRDSSGDVDAEDLRTPLTPPSPPAGALNEAKPESANGGDQDKELERSLIGSLVDSYGFKQDGLVKKTMSVSVGGVNHHMVSYYTVEDVKNHALPRPQDDARLAGVMPRSELFMKQNFRAPVEEGDAYAMDGMHPHQQMMYGNMAGYGVRPGQYIGAYPGVYNVPPGANPYGPPQGSSWPPQQVSQSPIAYGSHPGYANSPYANYYRPPQEGGDPKQPGGQHGTQDPYANSYGQPYGGAGPRAGAQQSGGPGNMMQAPYHNQVQQSPSGYGQMSGGRQSFGNSTPDGQPPQSYQPNSQPQHQQPPQHQQQPPYAVRSPAQSYGMQQSGPPSGDPHSPHHNVKSPSTSAPSTSAQQAADSQMPYRSGSYAVSGQTAPHQSHPNSAGGPHGGDMSGLGINSSGAYSSAPGSVPVSAAHHQQGYATYGRPPPGGQHGAYGGQPQQSYRGDMSSPVAAPGPGGYNQ